MHRSALPFALVAFTLLSTACKQDAPAPVAKTPEELAVISREVETASMRAWLARMLTCGDTDFLRGTSEQQRARRRRSARGR